MKNDLYDLLEQAALRAKPDEVVFSLPEPNAAACDYNRSYGWVKKGHAPLRDIYPRDILDFLQSVT